MPSSIICATNDNMVVAPRLVLSRFPDSIRLSSNMSLSPVQLCNHLDTGRPRFAPSVRNSGRPRDPASGCCSLVGRTRVGESANLLLRPASGKRLFRSGRALVETWLATSRIAPGRRRGQPRLYPTPLLRLAPLLLGAGLSGHRGQSPAALARTPVLVSHQHP